MYKLVNVKNNMDAVYNIFVLLYEQLNFEIYL